VDTHDRAYLHATNGESLLHVDTHDRAYHATNGESLLHVDTHDRAYHATNGESLLHVDTHDRAYLHGSAFETALFPTNLLRLI
jgi:hypothetical protein